MTTHAIEVSHLTKKYGQWPALNDISFAIEPGQIVGLMGDNGSGKTTLLKILAGILSGYEGNVAIHGHAPGPQSKAITSYLPDESALPTSLTADEAISMYADFFDDFDRAQASEMIDFFELPHNKRFREMSKGMREKAQVALTMSRRAKVHLLDEPISGVDPAARDIIMRGVLTGFDPDALMILSTHLIRDIEPIIDYAIFMRQGKILLAGHVDDLREEQGTDLDTLFRKVYAR